MIEHISVDLNKGKNSIIIDDKNYSDSVTEVSTYMSADGKSKVQVTFVAKEVEIKSRHQAISFSSKRSDEHPQKTMLDDFKEKYPNAPLEGNGTPKLCPHKLGYVKSDDCPQKNGFKIDCADCWSRHYEDGGEQK